jgi:hypothetical protein
MLQAIVGGECNTATREKTKPQLRKTAPRITQIITEYRPSTKEGCHQCVAPQSLKNLFKYFALSEFSPKIRD